MQITEGMKRVDVGKQLRELGDELLVVQAAQVVLSIEPSEQLIGDRHMCWGRQNSAPLPMDTVRISPAQS